MKVIIVGAGIGGLTAAISLRQAGIEASVYEASTALCPLDFGINLLPNAARELCELGLAHTIDQAAVRINTVRYSTPDGSLIFNDPAGIHAGYKWPHWCLRRADLHYLLEKTMLSKAGEKAITYNAQLSHFVQTGSKITAHFLNPLNGKIFSEDADLLIGADGLHSSIRKKMFAREGKPRFSGKIAYRGITLSSQILDGQSIAITGDQTKQFVCYPTSNEQMKRCDGKSLVDWIAFLPTEESPGNADSWHKEINPSALQEEFSDWRCNWLDLPRLINETGKVFQFPLYDREPHRQWTFGRVSLLGDAAHPMLPTSVNGAAQAIIDARALAFSLASCDDPMAGLEAYETSRLKEANAVVEASREESFAGILKIADKSGTTGIDLPLEELAQALKQFKDKINCSVNKVNQHPSYSIEGR